MSLSVGKSTTYRPQEKPKSYSGNRQAPYQRITFRNAEHVRLVDDDTYNLTNDRSFLDYFESFSSKSKEHDFETHLLEKSKRVHDFSILDCGAGTGNAMSYALLNYPTIAKCTGISMHFFNEAKREVRYQRGRLDWYVGKAEDVLPKLTQRYDLVTDVCGAYFYSKNRIQLIVLYFLILKPGGRAYIDLSVAEDGKSLKNEIKLPNGKTISFEAYLADRYPETFAIQEQEKNGRFFMITKTTARPPPLHFRVKKVQETSWTIKAEQRSLSKKKLREANLLFPVGLTVVPKEPTKFYSLRSLPCPVK